MTNPSLYDAALNAVAMIEAFDRDCEAVDYTDIDNAWVVFNEVAKMLRGHLTSSQLQELAEMKARHEAEIERETEIQMGKLSGLAKAAA